MTAQDDCVGVGLVYVVVEDWHVGQKAEWDETEKATRLVALGHR